MVQEQISSQGNADAQTEKTLTPPLKWAGGKRWQLPYVKPLFDEYQNCRLVEPFCGGLAVTLGLMPQEALLNDINPHLMNFYRWLKRGLVTDVPMKNEEQAYYASRDRFNKLLADGRAQSGEAAGLFYYLNRTGYNGLCRFNQQGKFNVSFGRYSTINYVRDFTPYKKLFRCWTLSVKDFESLKLKKTDFVYADPPYDVEFTQYAKEGFSWEDQIRVAKRLANHPGPVVLSNQATSRIRKLYRGLGFNLSFLEAPRMISCTGDRTPAREVLATRNV